MHSINLSGLDHSKAVSNLGSISDKINMSIRKLSSGKNQYVSEDPQNIPFIERLKSSLSEIPERINQARDKINLLQAEVSDYQNKSDVLIRIRELAIAYNNDTLSDSEKSDIQTEVDELSKIIDGENSYTKTAKLYEPSNTFEGEMIVAEDTESFLSLRQMSMTVKSITAKASEYDLSDENILSSLDDKISSFAGAIASAGGEITAMAAEIKRMQKDDVIFSDMFSRYTDTDFAEETAGLMKHNAIRDFASGVLKAHSDIEKDNVLALLNQF